MTPKAVRLATWRARLPVVAVVVACVAGVVSAVTGAANPVSAVQFLLPGHWVYNATLDSVFHVDGATGGVDARARIPGGPGDQVFQGDTSGYVVGSSRITEFGKSSLEVEETRTPVSRSTPVGRETAGGPYLVYQQDGKVVRLGDPALVLSLGGPVGVPVATRDGTLWLPRTSAGLLCQLPTESKTLSCPVSLPKGHAGALTVVADRLMFVDTTDDTLHSVEKDGLGAGRDLRVDAPDDARLSGTDVEGRVAILAGHRMQLVDTADDPADPVTVDLPDGDYDGPVATGKVVAVVDKATDTLSTYGSDGKPKETLVLPPENGDPRITRGEDDRIYVDGAEGEHVVVVDEDGGLTDVPITDDGDKDAPPPRGGADPDTTNPPPVTEAKPDDPPVEQQDPRRETPEPPPTSDVPPVQQQSPPPEEPPPPPPPPQVPATPPGAPAGVSATATDATATVSWGAASENRSPITGYTIRWPGNQTTAAPGDRTATISGLANGTSYVFTVTATNAKGTGPGSSSNPVIPTAPARPASAPVNASADYDPGSGTAVVNWNAPADMGTGTFSHYQVSLWNTAPQTVTGTTATFTGIQTTDTLSFTIAAVTTQSDGQQLVGAVETTTTEGGPPPSNQVVSLSRGAHTDEYCGPDPACAWMHVVVTGFPPHTSVKLDPHSDDPAGYDNPGHRTDTDGNGSATINQFAYSGVGHHVWVTATLPDGTVVESNHITWENG